MSKSNKLDSIVYLTDGGIEVMNLLFEARNGSREVRGTYRFPPRVPAENLAFATQN